MSDLARYMPRPRRAEPQCAACRAFRVDCYVPGGEGNEGEIGMCWICAHHVLEHGSTMGAALDAVCNCTAAEIYPSDVIDARQAVSS